MAKNKKEEVQWFSFEKGIEIRYQNNKVANERVTRVKQFFMKPKHLAIIFFSSLLLINGLSAVYVVASRAEEENEYHVRGEELVTASENMYEGFKSLKIEQLHTFYNEEKKEWHVQALLHLTDEFPMETVKEYSVTKVGGNSWNDESETFPVNFYEVNNTYMMIDTIIPNAIQKSIVGLSLHYLDTSSAKKNYDFLMYLDNEKFKKSARDFKAKDNTVVTFMLEEKIKNIKAKIEHTAKAKATKEKELKDTKAMLEEIQHSIEIAQGDEEKSELQLQITTKAEAIHNLEVAIHAYEELDLNQQSILACLIKEKSFGKEQLTIENPVENAWQIKYTPKEEIPTEKTFSELEGSLKQETVSSTSQSWNLLGEEIAKQEEQERAKQEKEEQEAKIQREAEKKKQEQQKKGKQEKSKQSEKGKNEKKTSQSQVKNKPVLEKVITKTTNHSDGSKTITKTGIYSDGSQKTISSETTNPTKKQPTTPSGSLDFGNSPKKGNENNVFGKDDLE